MTKKEIKDHLHGDSLLNQGNMEVFNKIYELIDEMVNSRVRFERKAFAIDDQETITKIEINAAKYYYVKIINIVNLTIEGWKV